MDDTVGRHVSFVDAVSDGDLLRLRAELRAHYLEGFPQQVELLDGEHPGRTRIKTVALRPTLPIVD